MTKVLFLYGSSARPGGYKSQALQQETDFHVEEPRLPFPDWQPKDTKEMIQWGVEALTTTVLGNALAVAQEAAHAFGPDVIVGSSMGGSLAIGIDSPAARVLIAPAMELSQFGVTLPNVLASRRIPVRTVILHAEEDAIVPFGASLRLLEQAANRADPGEAAAMTVIQEQLRASGYDTRHGRLIRIGCDHRCNDPHPHDTWNRDPHPHNAMVRAVRILAAMHA